MKLTLNRHQFIDRFGRAASIVPGRTTKPVLKNVKFAGNAGNVQPTLMATDLETGIRVGIDCDRQSSEPFSVLLPSDRFGAIIKSATDDLVSLEWGDAIGGSSAGDNLRITSGRGQWTLPTADAGEFPDVQTFSDEAYIEMPAAVLKAALRRTMFAVDVTSTRYALAGVYLETDGTILHVIATDGRRLAAVETAATSIGSHTILGSTQSPTIVPLAACKLIERSLDEDGTVRLAASPNNVLVSSGDLTIYSRLVEGRFPNWREVFPRDAGRETVTLPVGPLHESVRQAGVFEDEETSGVLFRFEPGRLTLQSKKSHRGAATIEMPIGYEFHCEIMLDPQYVAEFLKSATQEDSVEVSLKDAASAAVFTHGDGYRYIVMPLAPKDGK